MEIDDGEATAIVQEFLRGWVRENLHLFSNPYTTARELRRIQSLPSRVHYRDEDLTLSSGDKDLMKEMHYGSTRWPATRVFDLIDSQLSEQADASIPDGF